MTRETLQALCTWVESLSAEERTLLLAHVQGAIEAGTLTPEGTVRVFVADGTYRLAFPETLGASEGNTGDAPSPY